jgi:type II secretory pathway pseudopilin PulG
MQHTDQRRGLTIIDVLASILAVSILFAIVVPALARGRNDSGVGVSLNNLMQLNAALTDYAADFNDRQPTAIVDDFSTYGGDGSTALINFLHAHQAPHPGFVAVWAAIV